MISGMAERRAQQFFPEKAKVKIQLNKIIKQCHLW
jgi:hypothetical protein